MRAEDTTVVFMGSPAFAVPSLRALATAGYRVVAALTQPDKPAGRGGALHAPEVKRTAQELGIPVVQPDSLRDQAVQTHLASFEAEVFVVAAYGKLLPRAVLAMPSHGCINVHASLLPRWRGASPIVAALLAGDEETGVTLMELAPRMDAGPIIAARAMPLSPRDTTNAVEPRLAELGAELLVETLPGWLRGEIVAKPQDESAVTTCPLITKADGHLQSGMSAEQAERAVRAYNPWPGAFVEYRGQRLAIWSASVDAGPNLEPGTMQIHGKQPAVAFAGGWLVLEEVQRQGSKRMSGQAFLAGERGQLAPKVGLA